MRRSTPKVEARRAASASAVSSPTASARSATLISSWRRPSWLRFRIPYLLILAVMVLYSVKFVSKAWEVHGLALQVAAQHQQLYRQQLGNEQLRHQISYYKTTAFVYAQARSWGYVRKGDRPVIIVYRKLSPSPPRHARPYQVTTRPAPPWLQWWHVFFGR